MSSRAGNWMIATGALGMILGLFVLAAALNDRPEGNLLGVGACLFSLGALAVAGGIYLNARGLPSSPQSKTGASANAKENSSRRVRGGCDLCGTEAPVVQCKVHQLHLCGTCLAAHYDVRSCVFIPTSRRAGKGAAKARGA